MKHRFFRGTLLLLFIALCGSTLPARAEKIRAFDAIVQLQQNGTLDITENILMDFEGAKRHGIFRNIPLRRALDDESKIDITVQSVVNGKGQKWRYETSLTKGLLKIKIGDPKKLISGLHVYRIRYIVRGVVRISKGIASVEWNVTGSDWAFDIVRASFRFRPPLTALGKKAKVRAFAGVPGVARATPVYRSNDQFFFATRDLNPGEGLILRAEVPASAIQSQSKSASL